MASQTNSEIEDYITGALKFEQAGDISGALRLARKALEAARTNNLPLEYAKALNAVARYRFRLGQYETARQLAQEACTLTDPTQEAQAAVYVEALLLLGMCALETNSLTECETYYRRAADLAREIGHKLLFQRALHNLGSAVYLFRGQFDLAIAADSQSLQICRENDFSDWAMFPLITLAIAYQITRQRVRTCETLGELRAMAQPGSAGDGYACCIAGLFALDEGNQLEAEGQFTRARSIAEVIGDPSLNLDTRLGISRMYRLRGEISSALSWAEDALQFAERVGYQIYQGRARVERGRAAWVNCDPVLAESDFFQAEEIFIKMDMRADLAETRMLLAALLGQKKDARTLGLFRQASTAILSGGYDFLLERERSLVFPMVADGLSDSDSSTARVSAALLERIQRIPPNPINLVTLGGLTLRIGGRQVEQKELRQRRAGELLALLISTPGNSLTSAQVTEAMCPQKEPQAALDFYHHGISALRRLLEPNLPDRRFACRYLEASEERITLLVPPGSSIDYETFEECVQKKDWQAALALYRGEYLAEFRYAEWAITRRQLLSDRYEQALLSLAEDRFQQDDPAGCLDRVNQLLLHNAWQEQAVGLGMRAALKLGDRSTAIRLYQRLANVLNKELGLTPEKELQEIYTSLKKQPSKK